MPVYFLKKVQATPKMRAIKAKIRKNESERRKLSRQYLSITKSESKRLSKSLRKTKKSKKKKSRR